MKTKTLLTFNLLLLMATPLQADIASDAEEIMNRAQQTFRQFFPSNRPTQSLPPWLFRHYPESGIYLGINQNDSGVYLMGGVFGSGPQFFKPIDETLAMLRSQGNEPQSVQACDISSLPSGISVTQNGNDISVSTGGQCIKISEQQSFCDIPPDTDSSGAPVETGIHMVTQTNLQNYELSGISFDNPVLEDILTNQLRNSFSTKTCVIHAPAHYTYSVNFDMCLDITDQYADYASRVTITPPVTMKYTGSSNSMIVPDCFATDSFVTINLVTEETWVKQNGTWQKLN